MSVQVPVVAVVLGSVTPPQGDVVELLVHLGCTNEVSSFDLTLQNFEGKYSPAGSSALAVGLDGSLSLGRGATCPLVMTCRVESVKYQSTPTESYVRVSGRCWGERLFRRVVTKSYVNVKGEAIVKDLLDYYVGLSHVRGGVELVEDTDTTYTELHFEDTPVMDILRYVADSVDRQGVIGYDFRVAPDGKFEFFPRGTKTSSVSLAERVERCEFTRDVFRVRNKITVYGAADKSVPPDKVGWTQSLAPTDGVWTAVSGSVSLETNMGLTVPYSIRTSVTNLEYGACYFTLNTGHTVNTELYPELRLGIQKETAFEDEFSLIMFDAQNLDARCKLTAPSPGDGGVFNQWTLFSLKVGSINADSWVVQSGFDWSSIWRVAITCGCKGGNGSGNFWVGKLFFGGRRYTAMQEDSASQAALGLREQVEVNEELWSDAECTGRARALLANLKDASEALTLDSTLLDFGSAPIIAGDKVHVELPVEGVNADFRVLSAEYRVDGNTQTLETTLELGKEPPMLANYVLALHSKTDKLSRYKASRRNM